MNNELANLRRTYRKNLPSERDEVGKIILGIISVRYSLTESDFQRKLSSYVNLSNYYNDNQCIGECPLSDQQLLPLLNESIGIPRLIYKLLLEISDEIPSVTYAPLLFPLISFLSLYLTETEIKNVIVTLINDIDMIPSSTNDWNVHCHLLPVLGRQYATKAFRCLKLSDEIEMENIYFWPYALWKLPLPFLVRVVTCYFIDGTKVLLRAGLLLWKESYRRHIITGAKTCDWRESLATTAATITRTYTPQSFLDRMFAIRRLSRANVTRGKRGLLASAVASGDWISPTASRGYVAFKPNDVNPSAILSHAELIDIVRNLNPYLAQINKPVPLFASGRHGFSLRTLFNVAGETGATLLIIETAVGEVIGAFCVDPWSLKNRAEVGRFYGKGECFVFRVRPGPMAIYRWNQDRDSVLANMFQRATVDSLEVGGGGAIRINADLSKGTSSFSATFDSPPLTVTSKEEFLIKSLELLAFEEIH